MINKNFLENYLFVNPKVFERLSNKPKKDEIEWWFLFYNVAAKNDWWWKIVTWFAMFSWTINYWNWNYAEILCNNKLKVHTKTSLKNCKISLYEKQDPNWNYKTVINDYLNKIDSNTIYINIPLKTYKLNILNNNKCEPVLKNIWSIFADSLDDSNNYISLKVKIDCEGSIPKYLTWYIQWTKSDTSEWSCYFNQCEIWKEKPSKACDKVWQSVYVKPSNTVLDNVVSNLWLF